MAQTTKKKTTQQSGRRSASPSAPTPQAPNPAVRTAGGVLCLLLALCVAVSYFNAQAVLLVASGELPAPSSPRTG